MKAASNAEEAEPTELKEPETKKAKSYYEQIDGMKLDAKVVEVCREAVKGRGDGRVSVEDCKKVVESVLDGGKMTQAERWTVRYCLTEFNWTGAAVDHLHEVIKKECDGKDA